MCDCYEGHRCDYHREREQRQQEACQRGDHSPTCPHLATLMPVIEQLARKAVS